MANIKTVPNQKVVKVNKEKCDKQNLYAAINLEAMEQAAINLDAGAFKLWCYFAKNQNGYEFALSSKDAADNFGLKKKQYDNAIKELIEKNYLVVSKGNNYIFYEIPLVSKGNNDVVSKSNNVVVSKGNNQLYPLDIRNNTNTTYNNTNDNTEKEIPEAGEKGSLANPHIVSREWLIEHHNELTTLANGLFMYGGKFVKWEVAANE